MILNPFVFLIGRTIAKNRGVPDRTATTDGFAAALVKPPILGIVLVSALARNQVIGSGSTPAPTPTPTPIITDIFPTYGTSGDSVTILGANFGSAQVTSDVTFGGASAVVKTWSARSLTVTVPASGTSYVSSLKGPMPTVRVLVNVNGVDSNPMSFTLT